LSHIRSSLLPYTLNHRTIHTFPTRRSSDLTHKVESNLQHKKRPVGRPKTGRKSYKTVRLLTSTVLKINALENALGIKTQDATVDQAIDRVINSLTSDERRAYNLWLEMRSEEHTSELQSRFELV